jgi:hypothetical protein
MTPIESQVFRDQSLEVEWAHGLQPLKAISERLAGRERPLKEDEQSASVYRSRGAPFRDQEG